MAIISRIKPIKVVLFKSIRIAFPLSLAFAFSVASAVSELHPSFSIKEDLSAEISLVPGIGGIDLLPNGDGVICTWGGQQKSNGDVWIIPALATGSPGVAVKVATGLREPLGVKVIGNDFYVMEKPRIVKFTGSGSTWTKSTFWSLPTEWYNDQSFHQFSFNLVLRDNAFWFTTGSSWEYNSKDALQRGALIKVPMSADGFTQYARGLRNTDGIGLGPDNEFFTTDNQGNWRPVDALYHIPTKNIPANGRFFGYRTEINNACGIIPSNIANNNCPADPEYPPAIYIPYGEQVSGQGDFSISPTRPILLKDGPYKGQMLSGDVTVGGLLRYQLEKVNGEYQGAVFKFMKGDLIRDPGIRFGVHQLLYTPSGSLLVIGIGGGDNKLGGPPGWAFWGTQQGLDLLTPTQVTPFEILSIRSQADGFDVDFTKPAGASAGVAANYSVKTTVVTPRLDYGIDSSLSDNKVNVNVTSVQLSSDGLHAHLQLASLLTHRYYAIQLTNVVSATSEALYNNVGYYTLNNIGPASDAPSAISIQDKTEKKSSHFVDAKNGKTLFLFNERGRVGLYDMQGHKINAIKGK